MRKLAALVSIALAALLLASACGGGGGGEIETSLGVFTIEEVQVTYRWPPDCVIGCEVAEEGYEMLVVSLKPPEDLEVETDEEQEELKKLLFEGVYISGSDGSRVDVWAFFSSVTTTSDLEDLLAEPVQTWAVSICFTPSESAHDFKLYWPGNPPIDLGE